MIVLRLSRLLPLLLLLYITADLIDPSVPGVFFFDDDALFVDGIVNLKSHASRDLTPIEPMRLSPKADCNHETFTAELCDARPFRLQQTHWKKLKHDDSVSFGSSSSSDSSTIPPSS